MITPTLMANQSKQDAWIASIGGIILGIVVVQLYNRLARLYPEQTLTEYSELILGKWFGKLFSCYFLIFLMTLLAGLIRQTGDLLTTQIIVDTPIEFITIIFLVAAIHGVHLGIETFGRAAEIFYPIIMGLIFLFVIFLVQQMDIGKLQPILATGWKPVAQGSLQMLGLPILDMVVLLMIFPFINDKKGAETSFFKGFFYGGSIIVMLIFICTVVLGTILTEQKLYATYTVAKKINIGDFIQRIEAVAALIWLVTIFFKVLICLYSTVLAFGSIFNLKDPKVLLLPIAMFLYLISKIGSPNLPYFYAFLKNTWFPFSFSIGFLLPLLLLVIGTIKKNRKASPASTNTLNSK